MTHDYSPNWDQFTEGCRNSRSATKDRAIPTQLLALRDGTEIAYATCEVDAEGIAQIAVAMYTGFGCDEVFMAMDSYYAGSQKRSPHSGERWVNGEMEFDFQENPDTLVKEGLMFWAVGDNADITRHEAQTYVRSDEGFEFDEIVDVDSDTAEGLQQMFHFFWHKADNVYGKLMDEIRNFARDNEERLALLDKAAMTQMNEVFSYAQIALIAHDDGSVRTETLSRPTDGLSVSDWIGGDSDGTRSE